MYTPAMGFTFVKAVVAPATGKRKGIEREFLVDTGAIYSLLPAADLLSAGIKPRFRRSFAMADGRHTTLAVGVAKFKVGSTEGFSEIVFGKPGTRPLLGVVALESLGLQVDPVTKTLKPMPLYLMRL